MSSLTGSLTVHVLNEDQEPLKGATVFCNFPRSFLAVLPTNSERDTDENGIAEFGEVPVGNVEIHVNGSLEMEVEIDKEEHKDVTITLY